MLKDAFRQSSVSLVASERHGFIRFQYKSAKAVISFKSHGADAFFDRIHRGLLKSRSLIVIRPEPYSAPALGSDQPKNRLPLRQHCCKHVVHYIILFYTVEEKTQLALFCVSNCKVPTNNHISEK